MTLSLPTVALLLIGTGALLYALATFYRYSQTTAPSPSLPSTGGGVPGPGDPGGGDRPEEGEAPEDAGAQQVQEPNPSAQDLTPVLKDIAYGSYLLKDGIRTRQDLQSLSTLDQVNGIGRVNGRRIRDELEEADAVPNEVLPPVQAG